MNLLKATKIINHVSDDTSYKRFLGRMLCRIECGIVSTALSLLPETTRFLQAVDYNLQSNVCYYVTVGLITWRSGMHAIACVPIFLGGAWFSPCHRHHVSHGVQTEPTSSYSFQIIAIRYNCPGVNVRQLALLEFQPFSQMFFHKMSLLKLEVLKLEENYEMGPSALTNLTTHIHVWIELFHALLQS